MSTIARKNILLAMVITTTVVTVLGMLLGAVNMINYIGLFGSGTQEDPYILLESGVYDPMIDEGETLYFEYTAKANGYITVEAEGAIITVTNHTTGTTVTVRDTITMKVQAGDLIDIEIRYEDETKSGKVHITFTDEKDYIEDVGGAGLEKNPYILTESGVYYPVAGKGETKYFLYTPTEDGYIYVGAEGVDIVIIDTVSGREIERTDRTTFKVTAEQTVEIRLSFTDKKAAGEMELVFITEFDFMGGTGDDGAGGVSGFGTKENPYVLTESGTYTPYVDRAETKYFVYTATGNGFVDIRIPDAEIVVVNKTTGETLTVKDGVAVGVSKGDELEIQVSHPDPTKKGELIFDFTTEGDYKHGDETPVYKDVVVIEKTGRYESDLLAGQIQPYEHVAAKDGVIYVEAEDAVITVINKTTGMSAVLDEKGAFSVSKGDEIVIEVTWADPAREGTTELIFVDVHSYRGNMQGAGTEDLPYIIPGTGIYYPDVPKGEDQYLQYTPTEDGKIAIEAEGATIIVTNLATGADYKFENDAVIEVGKGEMIDIKVSWTDPAGDGEMEFIFTDETDYLDGIDGSGTKDDPYVLPESGKHNPEILEGESKYFIYTAREDGKLEIKAESAVITVINKTTGSEVTVQNGILSSVEAGDELEIIVSWIDENKAGEVEFIFTAETDYVNPDEVAVDIVLIEQQLVDGKLVDYPDEPIHAMPSDVISQIVKVRNDESPAYVRVRWDAVIYDRNGNPMEHTHEELERIVLITYNTDKWVELNGDDWWYYKTPLAWGEITEVLYTEFEMSGPNMTNEYQGCTIKMTITAQGVQAESNGSTVADAKGWRED